jgi:hypothetical protein
MSIPSEKSIEKELMDLWFDISAMKNPNPLIPYLFLYLLSETKIYLKFIVSRL